MLALLLLAEAGSGADRLRDAVADAVGRCRRRGPGEIVVCAPDPGARSPYRLPVIPGEDGFRIDGPVDSVSRERHRLLDVGGAGAQQNACSASGAGGLYGCQVKAWREADEQRGFRRPR